MNEADVERLFWEEFDGPTSPERLERIEALSHQQPAVRRQLDELRALAAELDAVEEVAPPAELRIEVRRRVANRPAYGEEAGASLFGWMRQALAAGWQARLAYATIGVLIGVFATYLVVGDMSLTSEADRSRLSGALNVSTTAQAQPYEVTLAGAAGTLRFFGDGTSLVATLLPAPNKTLELSLDRSDGGLDPLRVEEIHASRHEMTARPGQVRIVTDGALSVVLGVGRDGHSALTVRVSTSTGETVLDRQLDLAQLAGGI